MRERSWSDCGSKMLSLLALLVQTYKRRLTHKTGAASGDTGAGGGAVATAGAEIKLLALLVQKYKF
jgi:hypothetical protein